MNDNTRIDSDPEETAEWLDALRSVIQRGGDQRAHFLIETMIDNARRSGIHVPYQPNTAYVNTIPLHMEQRSPGVLGPMFQCPMLHTDKYYYTRKALIKVYKIT